MGPRLRGLFGLYPDSDRARSSYRRLGPAITEPENPNNTARTLAISNGIFYTGGPGLRFGTLDPLSGVVRPIRPESNGCDVVSGAATAGDSTLWIGIADRCGPNFFQAWTPINIDPQSGSILRIGTGDGQPSFNFHVIGPAIIPTPSTETTLIEIGAYDFHRRQNRLSKLKLTDYRHPFGLDISLAVLSDRPELLDAVNAALDDIDAQDGFQALASAEQVTYAPPRGGPAPNLRAMLK